MDEAIPGKSFYTKDPQTGSKVFGEAAEKIFAARMKEHELNPPKYEPLHPSDAKLEVSASQNIESQNTAFKARVVTAVVSDPLFRQNLMTALSELEVSRKRLVGAEAVQHFDDSLNALMEIIGVKRD